jgi:hypothetical protein
MTRFLLMSHLHITSMADIWYMHTLAEMHCGEFPLRSITRLSITDFTAVAHSQARASEVMDFLRQFENLHTLSFDIILIDLYHGLQGRVKSLKYLVTEFEFFRILKLEGLSSLVVAVKRNGLQVTPGVASLVAELESWFMEGVSGGVVFIMGE